ncbi:hypothetical protein [Barnesiella sp. An55]|uniref:hypothetical protein n=1 Tax=Barnesiella sp. An55 TaxID=1965646 RepID=UPI000B3B02C0|nr:hypothetical protein [Barnesiella sp. An55]
MNIRLLLIILVALFCIFPCMSLPWYIGKTALRQSEFQDGILTDCNLCADSGAVNVVSTGIAPGEGARPAITLDVANQHNRSGKRYAVYRTDSSGKTSRAGYVKKPVWGVVWGYRDRQNYHALLLRAGDDDFYGYQTPELQYTLFTVARGDTTFHVRWRRVSSTAIHPETGYNRLHIVPARGGFDIFLGRERECRLGFCHDDRLFGDQAGIYVGRGACVKMKNWSISPHEYLENQILWTAEELNEHLRHSVNPIEGTYEFLQASSTNYNIRLGGNYHLAMVTNGNGYLLIYESGAQRLSDQWQTGMVKAALRPTGLSNLFNVIWYDAEHKPIDEGVKAILAENGVLTIHFTREGVTLEWNRAAPRKDGERYRPQNLQHPVQHTPIAL